MHEKHPTIEEHVASVRGVALPTTQRDELLAALEECVGRLHWLNDPRTGNTEKPWIKQAEAVIAKYKNVPNN